MAHTGYIDWQRLSTSDEVWVNTGEGSTHVYAFWMADYPSDRNGLAMLRPDDSHPDWFCAGRHVDRVLSATIHRDDVVSPNVVRVANEQLRSRPFLASICLGSASAIYAVPDRSGYWWADTGCLTRRGRRLIKAMNHLYSREPVILTFLDVAPIQQRNPEAARGTATVAGASGYP